MKKKIAKTVLGLFLAFTVLMMFDTKVEAGCEVAQCDFIITKYDPRFGTVVCGKVFYAYWSGIDWFGGKSSAAWLDAQNQLTQHRIDDAHYN